MQPPTATPDRSKWRDLLLAIAIAAVLSIGWATTNWPRLHLLLLPDPDDMMRLAQVRDWIAGQGINDWTQYRMAPPAGAPMHWSRVNDLGIAGIILALTPAVGPHLAELVAVLAYPAALFACALYLSARIGRRLWGPEAAPIAIVLTGLAYPGTTVFIPGRIDHHALQVVLIQLFVLTLMCAPGVRAGLAAGVVAALSFVVGLETAPQAAALIGVLALLWVARGGIERGRLGGFALALGTVTLLFLGLLRPTYWTAALCDAFTPASTTGTLAVAAALAVLAAATPLLTGWRSRLAAGVVLGAGVLAATLIAYPSCVDGPYGAMSPFLRVAFMPHIGEANGIGAQASIAQAIAIAGSLTTGAIVAVILLARNPGRWTTLAPIAAIVVTSALVMIAQVRSAYIGAPLAVPVLTWLVIAARRRATWQLPAVIGAWLAGAGMAYVEIPKLIERAVAPDAPADVSTMAHELCNSGTGWQQVDRYPAGVVMAPTSLAAYLIGATHHATIGAGYHRNDAGNMAMYRFFLATPDRARILAAAGNVDYVAFCPGDFEEIQATRNFPASLATALQADRPPAWLRPLPLRDARLRFYRIE